MAMASASSMEAPQPPNINGDDDDESMVTILPQEVIDQLAELDFELAEGRKF